MRLHMSIRSSVILAIALFTLSLFLLIQYRYSVKVQQQLIHSEISRNTMLVETVVPVLSLNAAFELHDANREYLEGIISNNPNITMLQLSSSADRPFYTYHRPDEATNPTIDSLTLERPLIDTVTGDLLGHVEFRFSYLYFNELMQEHIMFSIKIFAGIIALLALFILYLNRVFKPLRTLNNAVMELEPSSLDQFRLERSHGYTEVDTIQNTLVDMLERIRQHTQALDDAARTLEQKVEERTHALEEKVEQIRQQEKLLISQSRFAAMGEMMSMIAHQWRQPLSNMSLLITNYKVANMMKPETRDEGEAENILDDISETLGYLSETIDDFQTYFKPVNSTESAHICDIIDKSTYFTEAKRNHAKVRYDLQCDDNFIFDTHANEMVQVIINILNNGIDAITASDSDERLITIRAFTQHQMNSIEITDTGGGITVDPIDKIFEPYFSTKSKNGTGLGLYMAKMIIKRHNNGDIEACNTPTGARFTIRIPESSEGNAVSSE